MGKGEAVEVRGGDHDVDQTGRESDGAEGFMVVERIMGTPDAPHEQVMLSAGTETTTGERDGEGVTKETQLSIEQTAVEKELVQIIKDEMHHGFDPVVFDEIDSQHAYARPRGLVAIVDDVPAA